MTGQLTTPQAQSAIVNRQSSIVNYADALPEGNSILYLLCRRLGVRITPRCIGIPLASDLDVVIAGFAFPGTNSLFDTRLQVFLMDRLRGEISISLYHNAVIALRQHSSFPYSPGHGSLLNFLVFLRVFASWWYLFRLQPKGSAQKATPDQPIAHRI